MLLGDVPERRSPADRRDPRRRHHAELRRPADIRRLDAGRPGDRGRQRGSGARRAPGPRSAGSALRHRRGGQGVAAQAFRDQTPAARPDRGVGDRQHLRRRGAVAGQGERRAPGRDADPPAADAGARGRRRGDARRAGAGRHLVRLAVRQRQRPVGLLRPIAGRLRPRRETLPALRGGDPAGEVHEPLVVLLPAVSAAARGADPRRMLAAVARSGPRHMASTRRRAR